MELYEAVRHHLEAGVPFARYVGISIERIADGQAEAALDQRAETSNHIATQHAGALYTLGEAASGAAMTGAFAEQLGTLLPVAAEAKIAYVRPATGRITARASTNAPTDVLRAQLDDVGKVRFAVDVSLFNEADEPVATMTVDWSVRRRKNG